MNTKIVAISQIIVVAAAQFSLAIFMDDKEPTDQTTYTVYWDNTKEMLSTTVTAGQSVNPPASVSPPSNLSGDFMGWFTGTYVFGGSKAVQFPYTPTGKTFLYQAWQINKGASGSASNPLTSTTINYNGQNYSINYPQNFHHDIYVVKGSSLTINLTVQSGRDIYFQDASDFTMSNKTGNYSYYRSASIGQVNHDYRLYAMVNNDEDEEVTIFIDVHAVNTNYTHTVSYNANGGSGSMSNTVVTNSTSGNSNVTLAANGFTRSNYAFAGWKVGNTVYQPGQTVAVAGDSSVTAYAQWTQYTHTVTYDKNGGTGSMSNTVVTNQTSGNSNVTLAANGFTRSNYVFAGWKVGSTVYQPGQSVAVAGNSSVTAVAQWTQYTHTVTYDKNGGTGSMSNTVVTNTTSGNSNVTLASNSFTRSGYTFTGWKIGNTVYQSGQVIAVGGNSSVTAVAQWAQNTLTASANSIYALSGMSYGNQISASANNSATLSYTVKSCTGGTGTVSSAGLVTYKAPSVSSTASYTVTVTVTATFPSGETMSQDISFGVTVDPVLEFTNSVTSGSLSVKGA